MDFAAGCFDVSLANDSIFTRNGFDYPAHRPLPPWGISIGNQRNVVFL